MSVSEGSFFNSKFCPTKLKIKRVKIERKPVKILKLNQNKIMLYSISNKELSNDKKDEQRNK